MDAPALTAGPGAADIDDLMRELDLYGFVVVRNLLPRAHVEPLASRLQELHIPETQRNAILNHLDPTEYAGFVPLLTNPIVLKLAEHLLGPEVKLCGDIGRVWAEPGQAPQECHTDLPGRCWGPQSTRPLPESCPRVNCIWALTDFTRENGATEVLPMSHFSRRLPQPGVAYRHLVPVEMPAGSAVVFHGAIWHRRGKNHTSAEHRMGVSVPYDAQWLDPVTSSRAIQVQRRVRDRMPDDVQQLYPHVADA